MAACKKILFPIISVLFGLTIAVMIIELLLRATGLSPTTSLHSVTQAEFAQVPGIWQPGQNFISRKIEALPHQITINSLGYRGSEIRQEKSGEEFRIFMTGDSFTFGDNVDNSQTFPAQLETYLRNRCDNNSIRVINAGIPGSTIIGQTEMIKRGLVLTPDLIMLVFYSNDLEDLRAPLWPRMAKNRALKSEFPISVVWPLLRGTAIWNFGLRLRLFKAAGDEQKNILPLKEEKSTYINKLRNIRNIAVQNDIDFVFTTFPGAGAVKGKSQEWKISWAENEADKENIPTIGMLQGLRMSLGKDIDKGYLLPHDGHASALGNSIAAKISVDFLVEHDFAPKNCK
jgi:hypothetical protein